MKDEVKVKMEINFDDLFGQGGTTLEIYICPKDHQQQHQQLDIEDIEAGWPSSAYNLMKGTVMNLEEIYYKDLICTYDKSTDTQKVTRKIVHKEICVGNLYIIVYKEDQVPAYMFPCTTDIPHMSSLTRSSNRINNRMYIVNDVEGDYSYMYTKYNHSANVDVIKMKQDLNAAISRLLNLPQQIKKQRQ